MARTCSLLRRRANLVDIGIRVRDGVAGYQFHSSTSSAGTFTQFALVPSYGLRSATAPDGPGDGNRGWTRFVFNPADYSLADGSPLWLKVYPVTTAGVVGSAEGPFMVLPYSPGSWDASRLVVPGEGNSFVNNDGVFAMDVPASAANGAPVLVSGFDDKIVHVYGTFSATLAIEGSLDSVVWSPLVSGITTAGFYSIASNVSYIRMAVTAYTSGPPAALIACRHSRAYGSVR